MAWALVCRVDDVAPGALRGFAVPGLPTPLLVAHTPGGWFASASTCPHGGISLLHGALIGCRVQCPGHLYELDLETGTCREDAALRLRCYPVRVEGDQVLVELGSTSTTPRPPGE